MNKWQQYVWRWQGGGYNWTLANNIEEARAIAKTMSITNLKVNFDTLRLAQPGEIDKLDNHYSSLLD